MKKLFTVVLSIMLFAVTVLPMEAENFDSSTQAIPGDYSFEYNEYQMLVDEYNNSLQQAMSHRLQKPDGKELEDLKRTIDKYPDYIYSLQKYSDIELEQFNYSKDQIYAIRHYDGSSKMTAAASATVFGNVFTPTRVYNSSTDKTTVRFSITVYWSGLPFIKATDTMSAALIGTNPFFESSSSCRVNYPDSTHVYSSMKDTVIGAGVSYNIVTTTDYSTIFSSASLTYKATAQGNVTVYGYGAAYAHRTITGSVGFGLSIGKSGSIGISFTPNNNFVRMWHKEYSEGTK